MDRRRAWRITGGVVLLLAVAAAATGAYLSVWYRPTAAQAWDDIAALHESVTAGLLVRRAHRLVSYALVPSSILLAVFGVAAARAEGRLGPLRVTPALAALVASFSGSLLPWNQLALWTVTVGTNLTGYRVVFSDQVRFVLVGGVQVSPDTIGRWLGVHVLAGAVLVIGAMAPLLPRRSGLADDGGGVLVEAAADVAGVP